MLAKAAGLAAAEGKPRRALRLAGSAVGLRQLVHAQLQHTDETILERQLLAARGAMTGDEAEAALGAGQAMSAEEAVGYALEDLAEDVSHRSDRSILSAREKEIARLLGQGLSNAEIADRLVISPGTAKRHVENILAKLGLRSRLQVANWLAQQEI